MQTRYGPSFRKQCLSEAHPKMQDVGQLSHEVSVVAPDFNWKDILFGCFRSNQYNILHHARVVCSHLSHVQREQISTMHQLSMHVVCHFYLQLLSNNLLFSLLSRTLCTQPSNVTLARLMLQILQPYNMSLYNRNQNVLFYIDTISRPF